MVEECDVLILGAGPAGIAAARSFWGNLGTGMEDDTNPGRFHAIVLEGRNRVGGRAFTSDALGVGHPLDHGAKWIHGSCAANRMVQLVHDKAYCQTPGDEARYEYRLSHTLSSISDEKQEFTQEEANENRLSDNDTSKTTPPFVDLEQDVDDIMILQEKNGQDPSDNDITQSSNTMTSKKRVTKIILPSKTSQEASTLVKRVAMSAFDDIVKNPADEPFSQALQGKIGRSKLEQVSLQDVILLANDIVPADSVEQQREQFTSLCRTQLLPKHPTVAKELASMETTEEKEAFLDQVMAVFNLNIHQYFESWEGASLHEISAKNGMETTCLPGGNTLLPFGYGGLVERLAIPLMERGNEIRLGYRVISVTTATSFPNSSNKPRVIVRCVLADGSGEKELHASACIVALPLGVLRAAVTSNGNSNDVIKFDPPLPPALCSSILSLGVSVRNKVELSFPSRWWPKSIRRFTIACSHMGQSPTYHPYCSWIVESPAVTDGPSSASANILVCYVGGEFAKEIEQKTDEQVQSECMQVLREADLLSELQTDNGSPIDIPDPTAIHVTRWLDDPYSRGSWTFYCKGSGPQDSRNFRETNECHNRGLFFAGEHTCHGLEPGDDLGCIHGAWLSGEYAAAKVVECLPNRVGNGFDTVEA